MVDQPSKGGKSSSLQTTEISLEVIWKIHEQNGARLTELVDELGLAKSTVYNHLSTLLDNEFIVKEGNEYQLSMLFFLLGQNLVNENKEHLFAKDIVKNLSEQTDLTADFNIEEHGRLISLYSDLPYSDRGFIFERRVFHMHSTASGKAILASLPEKRVDEILDQRGLPPKTEHTITSREELFDELDEIRDQGYALSDEESVSGLRSIAVPVTYPNGSAYGSLSIDGPTYELRDAVIDDCIESLFEAQADLESEISSSYR